MYERTECRLCDGPVRSVFKLADAPIANSFPTEPDSQAKRYPLELMQCRYCNHVQLRHVLTGLFEDYKYETPKTDHLAQSAKDLRTTYPKAHSVLEIGSNNGAFMDALRDQGFMVVGVDPAASRDSGALREYFTEKISGNFRIKFDLILANNVFAHIDDLQDVFRGIDHVLSEDGALIFEVQYLVDLIEGGAFDLVYHEHLDYHTLEPLAGFVKRFGMVMTDWQYIDTHGGSIRVTCRRHGSPAPLPQEPLDFAYLKNRVENAKAKLKQTLSRCQPLVAFGASAKASTLLGELGIAQYVSYCVDDTEAKQGRYIPGTDIQIRPVSELKDETVLLTAWNYERQIRARIPNKLINPFG